MKGKIELKVMMIELAKIKVNGEKKMKMKRSRKRRD